MSVSDSGTALITVVTEDYLPFARTLIQTAEMHDWPGDWYVLVVNAETDGLEPLETARLLNWDSVLSSTQQQSLLDRYDISEVCCALKPFAIEHVLSLGYDRVHYVDSDVCVLGGAAVLDEALDHASVSLTPHYFEDPPMDGRLPDQLSLLRAGVFNAGYVGVRATPVGRSFLAWWAEKCSWFGFVDPYLGMHGDQRWLDLVPAKFPEVGVVQSRAVNVGYWNLHERDFSKDDGRYCVDGEPIVFFHFSGFDPSHPRRLSKYQNRFDDTAEGPVTALSKAYADRLLANGYQPENGRKGPKTTARTPLLIRLRNRLIDYTLPYS